MNLNIQFGQETPFNPPCRPILRPGRGLPFGTRYPLRLRALTEGTQPDKRHVDWCNGLAAKHTEDF